MLASNLLQYQTDGSATTQQKLGDRWLDEARTLAVNRVASIDPYELEIVKERLFMCVLHPLKHIRIVLNALQSAGYEDRLGD